MPMSKDYLINETNWVRTAEELGRQGIMTKSYTRDVDGVVTPVGLRVGIKPDHVVAFWGDTLRHEDDGSFTVWRLTRVKPELNLTWHTVDADEDAADMAFSFELYQAERRDTCDCAARKADEFTLAIDSGSIEIRHTACGKVPWFMRDDWNESVSMNPQKIIVSEVSGCSTPYPCGGFCECGPEINLKTPEGEW